MDEPIAERSFYVDGTPEQSVVVFRFWRPYQPKGDYPRCAYELLSPQGVEKGEVSGADSMDCILTCLSQAGTKIAGLNESTFGGRLRWEASPEGGRGLGLPTIEDHWPFNEKYQSTLQWSSDQRQSEPDT